MKERIMQVQKHESSRQLRPLPSLERTTTLGELKGGQLTTPMSQCEDEQIQDSLVDGRSTSLLRTTTSGTNLFAQTTKSVTFAQALADECMRQTTKNMMTGRNPTRLQRSITGILSGSGGFK